MIGISGERNSQVTLCNSEFSFYDTVIDGQSIVCRRISNIAVIPNHIDYIRPRVDGRIRTQSYSFAVDYAIESVCKRGIEYIYAFGVITLEAGEIILYSVRAVRERLSVVYFTVVNGSIPAISG